MNYQNRWSACNPMNTPLFKNYCCGSPIHAACSHAASTDFNVTLTPLIQLTASRKRRHATVWRVVALLIGQPVITAREVARQLNVTFPAANDAIAELVSMEILRPSTAQRRNRVFQAHQVLNALHTGMDAVLDGG